MRIFALALAALALALAALWLSPSASAQSHPEAAAIRQAALDYIDGWYEADAARMERALHPELAKRIVQADPATGKSQLRNMTAAQLIEIVRKGGGSQIPKEKRMREVTLLDTFGNTATVKIDSAVFVDYVHLAKWNGEWKIINVLWELKPRRGAPATGRTPI